MTAARTDQVIRFWAKVAVGERNDCWLWMAGLFANGYGAFTDERRRTVRAHRFSYEFFKGPIPTGLVVLHSCDTPKCCNPHHLFVGTGFDNIKDRDEKGRQAYGERSGVAKLTQEQVDKIKNDQRGQRAIAADYGVCKSTIGYIKRGQYWRHV